MSSKLNEPPFHDNPAPSNNFWSLSWFEWLRDLWGNVNQKISAVGTVIANHFAMFNSDGDLVDSGKEVPSGEVVGTTDIQTLTNKSADYLVLLNNATDLNHALRLGQAKGLFLQDDVPLPDAGTEPTLNTILSGLNPGEVVIVGSDHRISSVLDLFAFLGFEDENIIYADELYDYTGNRFITENLIPEVETLPPKYSAFGDIHVHDGVAAQSILTGATYTKLTSFADNGESLNCTPDATNNRIILDDIGCYYISASINGFSGTANVTFKFSVFLDGVEQNQIHGHRKYSVASDYGSTSISGFIISNTKGAVLDVRARHDNIGNIDFTVSYMNLSTLYAGCGRG